jgi:hypothetical protein
MELDPPIHRRNPSGSIRKRYTVAGLAAISMVR